MASQILNKYILELIVHFECEAMNYFERPFSSDVDSLSSWATMDSATTEKPLTVVLDLEARAKGIFTGRVKGVFLFDININTLKTYEGLQEIEEHMEYFSFEEPMPGLIREVYSPIDEVSFGYTEGFREKILGFICQ